MSIKEIEESVAYYLASETQKEKDPSILAKTTPYPEIAHDIVEMVLEGYITREEIVTVVKGRINSVKGSIQSLPKDPHKDTASKILRTPKEDLTKDQRHQGMVINFGLLYGRDIKKDLKVSQDHPLDRTLDKNGYYDCV